jgi:hypothetical protein
MRLTRTNAGRKGEIVDNIRASRQNCFEFSNLNSGAHR